MPDASSWRTNRQLRETEDWKQQARAALKLTPSLSHPHSCLSMMTGFENPRETWNPLMGSRPGCSDSLRKAFFRVAQRLRHSQCVGSTGEVDTSGWAMPSVLLGLLGLGRGSGAVN